MSVDVPGRRHELSCFVQLVTWQRRIVVVIGMHSGGGWQSNSCYRRWWLLVEVDMGCGWSSLWMVVVERKKVCLLLLFMCCSQQTLLTWLSMKEGWSLT